MASHFASLVTLAKFRHRDRMCIRVFLVLFLLWPVTVAAASPSPPTLREVLRLIDQKQWGAARATAEDVGVDAQVLYEWINLSRDDEIQDFSRYLALVKAHPELPLMRKVRANAERAMPMAPAPADILALYMNGDPTTARGMVALITALRSAGRGAEVSTRLDTWFTDASLSTEEMATIVQVAGTDLSTKVRQSRINRLVLAEQGRQAVALARTLGPNMVTLIEARLALRARSAGAGYKLSRVPAEFENDPGLITDRLRYRRKMNDKTGPLLEIFNALPADFRPLDQRSFWTEHQALIYRLMDHDQDRMAYQVATRNFYDDPFARGQATWMAGYIALARLKDPNRACPHFQALYQMAVSPLTRARAAYYAGLCAPPTQATGWFQKAAVHNGNFYGQLAAKRISSLPSPAGPPAVTPTDRTTFAATPLGRYAQLLAAAGDTVRAEQMIARMAALYEGQPGLVRQTVDLALTLKLTSAAVKVSREAAMDGIDFGTYVYPTLDGVGTGTVEPALIYAIIRQESGFDVDAVSSAGARGLMQLMPSTAKAVARTERLSITTQGLTDQPHKNVRLGSAYVRQLLDRYDGSYALTAAAYNAGPSRVNEWIREIGDPRTGEIELTDWIEQIPFYETRNYVQRILEGVTIYRHQFKEPMNPKQK